MKDFLDFILLFYDIDINLFDNLSLDFIEITTYQRQTNSYLFITSIDFT